MKNFKLGRVPDEDNPPEEEIEPDPDQLPP